MRHILTLKKDEADKVINLTVLNHQVSLSINLVVA